MATADTDQLLRRAATGDNDARDQLLVRHRDRLRRMIAVRLDRRLLARLDPSDVVQDVLVQAHRRLESYLHDRPLPFYPWLRQIASEVLLKLHRRHLHARKRQVDREEPLDVGLPDESALELAERLLARGSSPSRHALREELRRRVRRALAALSERDREVLVLRHLEQLSTREVAEVLQISEGAVKTRQVRALARLQALLGREIEED
jgi:RNA polymerase sigma-70 factor (ECF subfamily)